MTLEKLIEIIKSNGAKVQKAKGIDFFKPAKIALINPSLSFGEEGQYVSYQRLEWEQITKLITKAFLKNLEIRLYYYTAKEKMIIAIIPGGHVHPFHFHQIIDEAILVWHGQITTVNRGGIKETDLEKIKESGEILNIGEQITAPAKQIHSIANLTTNYAIVLTSQLGLEDDWVKA